VPHRRDPGGPQGGRSFPPTGSCLRPSDLPRKSPIRIPSPLQGGGPLRPPEREVGRSDLPPKRDGSKASSTTLRTCYVLVSAFQRQGHLCVPGRPKPPFTDATIPRPEQDPSILNQEGRAPPADTPARHKTPDAAMTINASFNPKRDDCQRTSRNLKRMEVPSPEQNS